MLELLHASEGAVAPCLAATGPMTLTLHAPNPRDGLKPSSGRGAPSESPAAG